MRRKIAGVRQGVLIQKMSVDCRVAVALISSSRVEADQSW